MAKSFTSPTAISCMDEYLLMQNGKELLQSKAADEDSRNTKQHF